jgi:hypothetical protein
MTTDHASLLMNRYFDNEASDDEMRELFLHLSQSEESRTLFAGMKRVQDVLMSTHGIDVPHALDEKFSSLAMLPAERSVLQRQFTISLPSALLSGFVVCLLSFMLSLMASKALFTPTAGVERESALNSMYGDHAPVTRVVR